jgi:hypothetical protein
MPNSATVPSQTAVEICAGEKFVNNKKTRNDMGDRFFKEKWLHLSPTKEYQKFQSKKSKPQLRE